MKRPKRPPPPKPTPSRAATAKTPAAQPPTAKAAKKRAAKRPVAARVKQPVATRAKQRAAQSGAAARGRRSAAPVDEPEFRAQQLIFDAWETPDADQRAELAREAIGLWPDCADAYGLLAAESTELGEKIAFFHQAVEAGARAIGERAFVEEAGMFWGVLETRPYMRARAGLAGCLRERGDSAAAADHYQALLQLNPDDNQGLRYLLASCLLEIERHDALSALLARYRDEASAAWAYTRALLGFRLLGDSARTQRALRDAVAVNRHVPALLLAKKRPRHLPDWVGFGDENEALVYVDDSLRAWMRTAGALEWLRRRA